MTTRVLCPGPSLATYSCGQADCTIAVNRAGMSHACDWWAALDYPTIRDNGAAVLGMPSLFTCRRTATDIAKRPIRLARFARVEYYEDVHDVLGPAALDMRCTMFGAVILAVFLGTTQLEIWGADWIGVTDYDGVAAGENRGESRWRAEREAWSELMVPWLSERNVNVIRHAPVNA